MGPTKVFPFAVAMIATAALGGCKQQPTEEDYDDVAQAVGALVANDSGGEVGSMQDGTALAQGESPAGVTQSGNGSWSGKRLGLEYSYSLTCYDQEGAVQGACSAATTDAANLVVAWGGELTLPRYQGSIERTGDWTLSGLQSDVAQFDGHGSFEVHSEFQGWSGAQRSFHLTYDAQYDAVRFSLTQGEFQSGRIQYDVHAERTATRRGSDVEVELDIEAVVTFDGSGDATLTLDGERTYHVELSTGHVSKE